MLRSKPFLLLLSVVLGSALSVDSRAQAVYGSISGTVTDAAGAVVPNATVTITSVERGTSDTVQTNDSGLYVKERLLPGLYEVKVEQANFKQKIVQKITINVDTSTSVDVSLEAGQITEVVTITGAEGDQLKT
ncbi:MAG: carboxypeptidase-like regulatory domain-containing protein, partial [Acidobacteriota bacterium]|nr:carboxypeptidase-like regulatory domain-containing protein [Acidobacteriota bacterium]